MSNPRVIDMQWAEHVANPNAQSLTLIGERMSGVSDVADELVRQALNLLGAAAPAVVRVDAAALPRPASDGVEALRVSSLECLRLITQLASDQRGPVDRIDPAASPIDELKEVLAELLRAGRPPILYIDHFEALASRFDRQAWDELRSLVDTRRLQVLAVSRLQINEMDPLTGSRLFGVIPYSHVVARMMPVERRQFVEQRARDTGLALDAAAVAHLAALGGGWRALTDELLQLIAREAEKRPVGHADVDAVLSAAGGEVRACLGAIAPWLDPEAEPDVILAAELAREAAAIFTLLYAPAGSTTLLNNHLQRLKRLGTLEGVEPTGLRFTTPLLQSLASIRWRELRRAGAPVDPEYAAWCTLDEAMRRWIRLELSPARIAEVLTQVDVGDVVENHRAARIWWGDAAGEDPLDDLTAEALLDVLRSAGFADEWLWRWDASLRQIALTRPTLLRSPGGAPWGPNRRQAEEHKVKEVAASLTAPSSVVGQRPHARRVVRWLHISDIHLGRKVGTGEDFVLRSFLDELRRESQREGVDRLGPRPDLVFVTGDLANHGRPEEYARVAPLLDEILGVLGLSRRHLFLVPGNHDVYRPDTAHLVREYQDDTAIRNALEDGRWRRLYRERLTAFDAFYQSFFANVKERLVTSVLGFPQAQSIEVRGGRLLIHLLDPLLCGGLHDDRGKLLLGLIARRAEFVDSPAADLRLALMHHPPDWLCMPDQNHFGNVVARNIDLLLGGHVHIGEYRQTIGSKDRMCELRAGALFQGDSCENTAQFAEFDFDSRQLEVFPIMYKKDRDRWVRDPRFGEHPTYTHSANLGARALR